MENLEIMKGVIFRNDWCLLSDKQIEDLFDEHYDNVTIKPNYRIINCLRLLEIAILEIIEDRTKSTVYRIRQTDEVFQIFKFNNEFLCFNTEDYNLSKNTDDLVKDYGKKSPIFKAERYAGGKVIIEHLKSPRFKAHFINNVCDRVEWIDKEPIDSKTSSKLTNKAGAFYTSYLKK